MTTVLLICLLLSFVAIVSSELRVCSCPEVNPCMKVARKDVVNCDLQCRDNIRHLGVPLSAIRSCMLEQKGKIRKFLECERKAFGKTCGTDDEIDENRTLNSTKTAVIKEVRNILKKSGLLSESEGLVGALDHYGTCFDSCMERSSGECFSLLKQSGCGIKVPNDDMLIRRTKKCAIKAGFDTQGLREVCTCIAKSGFGSIQGFCDRFVFS